MQLLLFTDSKILEMLRFCADTFKFSVGDERLVIMSGKQSSDSTWCYYHWVAMLTLGMF